MSVLGTLSLFLFLNDWDWELGTSKTVGRLPAHHNEERGRVLTDEEERQRKSHVPKMEEATPQAYNARIGGEVVSTEAETERGTVTREPTNANENQDMFIAEQERTASGVLTSVATKEDMVLSNNEIDAAEGIHGKELTQNQRQTQYARQLSSGQGGEKEMQMPAAYSRNYSLPSSQSIQVTEMTSAQPMGKASFNENNSMEKMNGDAIGVQNALRMENTLPSHQPYHGVGTNVGNDCVQTMGQGEASRNQHTTTETATTYMNTTGNTGSGSDVAHANINGESNGNAHAHQNNDDDSDSDIEVVAVTPAENAQPMHHHRHHQQQMQQYQHQQHQMQLQQQQRQQQQQQQKQMQQQYHQQQQKSSSHTTMFFQGYEVKVNYMYKLTGIDDHIPTWGNTLPRQIEKIQRTGTNQHETHAYKLSLLSHEEFTVTPVHHHTNSFYFEPTINGLRRPIKDITRKYGKEGDKAVLDEGRWRIPLSVYKEFSYWLYHQPNTVLQGIPQAQLNIASLGKAAADRGYPDPQELMDKYGVPRGLSMKLAPYQRGGVDFVMQRTGRALIADEMGLGKTVQGIASMTCFEDEWPLLVLSPSSARYHWEAEFLQWLGDESPINIEARALEMQEAENKNKEDDYGIDLHQNEHGHVGGAQFQFVEERKADPYILNEDDSSSKRKRGSGDTDSRSSRRRKNIMRLLRPHEINVLGSSNEAIIKPDTRVTIISYGLIPNLVKKGLLKPGDFKCCIVDESHMLKNKRSKRTMSIMPLLQSATRVVMLSGTPALSKPAELFPQLHALGAQNGWWENEEEFMANYVTDKYSDPSFAELHALLTSTVMIRRMKNDILTDMPAKVRESAHVNVRCEYLKNSIKQGLLALREGKGVLGKLSVLYQKDLVQSNGDAIQDTITETTPIESAGDDSRNRKAVLNHVFKLTGDAKVPILVDMLKRWIGNPTNGKICIFAHHISVLDGIVNGAELSNAPDSRSKFIRIDGSTLPRARQEQITSFQNDPSVRIAILGITAAGVGVTLTAASTIWFAELFWTPAIMIQAEDRCHRIGQQARVRCLYTIARGTLDEVLWILLKRKFRSLGEFVEGKEMMDIVVHKSFNNEFDAVDRNVEKDDGSDSEIENEDLADEDRIQHDLEELAMEEELAAKGLGGDDDEVLDDAIVSNANTHSKKQNSSTQSEENVICILDDDEEEPPANLSIDEVSKSFIERPDLKFKIDSITKMPNIVLYQVFFPGPKYNLGFDYAFGRIFIENTSLDIFQRGDVLVGIDSWRCPPNISFQAVMEYMKKLIRGQVPIRVQFGRDADLTKMYVHFKKLKEEAMQLQQKSRTVRESRHESQIQAPTADDRNEQSSDVIVLDD